MPACINQRENEKYTSPPASPFHSPARRAGEGEDRAWPRAPRRAGGGEDRALALLQHHSLEIRPLQHHRARSTWGRWLQHHRQLAVCL